MPDTTNNTSRPTIEENWQQLGGDEIGEPLLAAAKLMGIERVWYVSGSELAWFQEVTVKNKALGRPAPELMSMVHESVALAAAMGDTMITNKPSIACGHVDVGLLNMGGQIHNALRGQYPVLMMSGYPATGRHGSTQPMTRNVPAYWGQQIWDPGQIVRQYTKWDYRLTPYENPALIMSRAIQTMLAEPRGPAYMALAPEAVRAPLTTPALMPPTEEWQVPRLGDGDEDSAREAAQMLVDAENPIILVQKLGRHKTWVEKLVRFAEDLAVPVHGSLHRMNFPQTHDLWEAGPRLCDADVVMVIDYDVPWMPGVFSPSKNSKIILVGNDPLQQDIPVYEFPAHLRVQADSGPFLDRVLGKAQKLINSDIKRKISDRRARLTDQGKKIKEHRRSRAESHANKNEPTRLWLDYQLGQLLDSDDIVVNEFADSAMLNRSKPGTHFMSGGSSLGWSGGAAIGAKMAAPDRTVINLVGDGAHIFSVPQAWLWASQSLKAPILTVIWNNRGYRTGTSNLQSQYPAGYAVQANDYHGGFIDPPPNYAGEAAASGAYGETVKTPMDVAPALKRGLEAVRKDGISAVIDVWLPKHLNYPPSKFVA